MAASFRSSPRRGTSHSASGRRSSGTTSTGRCPRSCRRSGGGGTSSRGRRSGARPARAGGGGGGGPVVGGEPFWRRSPPVGMDDLGYVSLAETGARVERHGVSLIGGISSSTDDGHRYR